MHPGQGKVIGVLQAGRAIAALAVVISHAARAAHDFGSPLPVELLHVFERGRYGVDFFFVLSGFIILTAHGDDAAGGPPARAYLYKRLTRIFVPYLPVSLGMIGLYLAIPGLSAAERDWSLLTSLTLIPTGRPPALAVAWTLVHEVMFYAIFLLGYVVPRFAWVVAGWMGLIVLGMAVGLQSGETAPNWASVLAPINVEFVAGMVAALAVRRMSPRYALLSLAIGTISLVGLFVVVGDPSGFSRMGLGIAMAAIVTSAVWFELNGHFVVPAWLIVLGNASYAIYLVHLPIVGLVARAVARLGGFGGWPAILVLCTVLGGAGGLLYHLAFEKPALAWFRRGRGRYRTV